MRGLFLAQATEIEELGSSLSAKTTRIGALEASGAQIDELGSSPSAKGIRIASLEASAAQFGRFYNDCGIFCILFFTSALNRKALRS